MIAEDMDRMHEYKTGLLETLRECVDELRKHKKEATCEKELNRISNEMGI